MVVVSAAPTHQLVRCAEGVAAFLAAKDPVASTVLGLARVAASVVRPHGATRVREHREVTGEGLAITLCIDRSGSMLALDLADSVVRRSRLDVVKDVVDRFVRGDTTMAGRRGDLLSIVQFGTHADEVTPPTFDHEYVAKQAVEGLEVSALESERATAIGDALGLAVERLDAFVLKTSTRPLVTKSSFC